MVRPGNRYAATEGVGIGWARGSSKVEGWSKWAGMGAQVEGGMKVDRFFVDGVLGMATAASPQYPGIGLSKPRHGCPLQVYPVPF